MRKKDWLLVGLVVVFVGFVLAQPWGADWLVKAFVLAGIGLWMVGAYFVFR